jgi:uncharacterized protein (DUF4415 family)
MTAKPAASKSSWVDPDDPEMTDEEIDRFVEQADLYHGDRLVRAGKVGRPKAGQTKALMSLRLDSEVIEWFRATGPGWQTRINDALLQHVRRAKRRAAREGRAAATPPAAARSRASARGAGAKSSSARRR